MLIKSLISIKMQIVNWQLLNIRLENMFPIINNNLSCIFVILLNGSQSSESELSIFAVRLKSIGSLYFSSLLIQGAQIINGVLSSVLLKNLASGSVIGKAAVKCELADLVIASSLNETSCTSLNIKVAECHIMPRATLLVLAFPRHILSNYIKQTIMKLRLIQNTTDLSNRVCLFYRMAYVLQSMIISLQLVGAWEQIEISAQCQSISSVITLIIIAMTNQVLLFISAAFQLRSNCIVVIIFLLYFMQDIYSSTKNWNFTHLDEVAEQKFSLLEQQTRNSAPEDFYHKQTLTHLEFIRNNKLYPLLKTLPKAVMHHCHFDCNEDQQFYRLYVITDPTVFLSSDRATLKIGTKEQALKEGWISMDEARKRYADEELFVRAVSSITMFNKEELQALTLEQKEMWDRFEVKISNFFVLIFALHIFKKYVRHILLKYIKNGYDRVQFRAFLAQLNEYDAQGRMVKQHSEAIFTQAFDEVYNEVKKDHPDFTVGFVFFGLKVFSQAENQALFTKICELNWDKTIGLDFVQQQDQFGSLSEYDPIIDRVLARYPHLDYKKVYHAGETKDHRTHNIEVAVKAGSVRIGHGFNILQTIQFLHHCKHICFQKNPLSNLVLGYNKDAREASAPILLGLGYAVTINPDDPGKFGVEDTTVDYFIAAISYNWTLRDLKLIAFHSINHAICDEHTRTSIIHSFNKKWNKWIRDFVQQEHLSIAHKWIEPDIYSNTRHWKWSQKDAAACVKFEVARNLAIDSLPVGFYQQKVLSHLNFMKQSPLYKLMKTIPKGALHHDHFDCNQDHDFYRQHIITDPNIYLNKDHSAFCIGTVEEANNNGWKSWTQLREELQSQQALVNLVASRTMITPNEMEEIAGTAKKFWVPFEEKIMRFITLLQIRHVFKKYSDFILRKLANNGYDRIEFRALIWGLKQYNAEGQFIKEHSEKEYTVAFDEAYDEVKKDHPNLSVGFIFFGLKAFSAEQNEAILSKVCQINWTKTVGIDFVQQQDLYASLDTYDEVADKVLMKYPHLNYKKCYHAGDTRNHMNDNIQIAVKAGSVRIGHGLNIIQRIEFLPHCRNVCFELNPISNLITASSARLDLRLSNAPILLGLGYPVSISPDDPGKFGYEDTTVDYFASAVSFNWTLKHLKLVAIHSINHAICTEGTRLKLERAFNQRWEKWIDELLSNK